MGLNNSEQDKNCRKRSEVFEPHPPPTPRQPPNAKNTRVDRARSQSTQNSRARCNQERFPELGSEGSEGWVRQQKVGRRGTQAEGDTGEAHHCSDPPTQTKTLQCVCGRSLQAAALEAENEQVSTRPSATVAFADTPGGEGGGGGSKP